MFSWKRYGGYEVSSQGDVAFSAFYAILNDGRSIECHYQCDVKGYDPGGVNWRLGKGKPPIRKGINLWEEYKALWVRWGEENPRAFEELKERLVARNCYILSDRFANSSINQARAIAEILNNLD